jgi:hypothetical protein
MFAELQKKSQCSGSGCIFASWIQIRNSIFLKQNNEQNLDFYCFAIFYHFLCWKNDVNVPVPSKRIKYKKVEKKNYYMSASCSLTERAGSGSVNQRYGSEDPDSHPDPYQYVTDPEHWKKPLHFFVPGCQRPCRAISFFSLYIISVYSEEYP